VGSVRKALRCSLSETQPALNQLLKFEESKNKLYVRAWIWAHAYKPM